MPTYRFIGDVRTAFAADVDFSAPPNIEDEDTLRTIAEAAGATRFGREQTIDIGSIVELDADGNELESPLRSSQSRAVIIDSAFAQRPQGRVLTQFYSLAGRKVRIAIYADSYAQQSYAKAELFDGERWNTIATTEPSLMRSAGKCHGNEFDVRKDAALVADANEVLRKAVLLLA